MKVLKDLYERAYAIANANCATLGLDAELAEDFVESMADMLIRNWMENEYPEEEV